MQPLIQEHPTYGYRRLWALLRHRLGTKANQKKTYRHYDGQTLVGASAALTSRPRVKASASCTAKSDRRGAMDMTHVDCGREGCVHLLDFIDCQDRELLGWEFARRSRTKEVERAIEQVCIVRFGTLRPVVTTLVVGSGKGLVFQSRIFKSSIRPCRMGLSNVSLKSERGICLATWLSQFRRGKRRPSANESSGPKLVARQSSGYRRPREYRGARWLEEREALQSNRRKVVLHSRD